jgi:hypothetical protein
MNIALYFGIYVVASLVAYGLGRRSVTRQYTVLERGVGTPDGLVPCLFIYPANLKKPGYILNQKTGRVIQIDVNPDGTYRTNALTETQNNLATLTEEQGCVDVQRDANGNIVGAQITPKGHQVLKDLELDRQDLADEA